MSDEALVRGIRILAEATGIFTETAGGTTVAAALELARRGQLLPTTKSFSVLPATASRPWMP